MAATPWITRPPLPRLTRTLRTLPARLTRTPLPRVTLVFTALTLLASVPVAHAHHFNRGHFVPAFRLCSMEDADTLTSLGIPACSAPALLSDCTARPLTALRVKPGQKSSSTMEPKGRRRTRENDGYIDMDSRVGVLGVQTCDGAAFTGTLKVEVVYRMQRDDPACATGHCTIPDITYTHDLPCDRGSCSMTGGANAQLVAQGLPPLPSDQTYRMSVVRTSILDLDGNPLLNAGLAMSGETVEHLGGGSGVIAAATSFLSRVLASLSPLDAQAYGSTGVGAARRSLTRLVQAFAPCDPGATDTVTGDGLPACTTRLLSDCALDPNAINPVIPETGNFIDKGKGKIDFGILGEGEGMVLRTRGWLEGLYACDGSLFTGTIGVRAVVRATVLDPACTGGSCTTVETPLISGPVNVVDGKVGRKEFRNLDLEFPIGDPVTDTVNAEIVDIQILDPSGNPFMVGPSWLVRCNFDSTTPNQSGGDAFCFGN